MECWEKPWEKKNTNTHYVIALMTERTLKLEDQWKTSTSLASLTQGFLLVQLVQAATSDEHQLPAKTLSRTPAPHSSSALILEPDWCSSSCTCGWFAAIRGRYLRSQEQQYVWTVCHLVFVTEVFLLFHWITCFCLVLNETFVHFWFCHQSGFWFLSSF